MVTKISDTVVETQMEGSFQHNPATTTGLTFGMRSGEYNTNDNITTFTDPTVTLVDDAVNSVFVDAGADGTATPVLKAQTAGSEDAADLRQLLFTVTTVSGAITAIVDHRTGALLPILTAAGGGGGSVTPTGLDVTLYAEHLFNYYRPDGYWPLNEASGGIAFDQASGAHATYPKEAAITYRAAGPSVNLPHAFESDGTDEWAGVVLPWRWGRTAGGANSNLDMGGVIAFWIFWPTQTETEDTFMFHYRENDPNTTDARLICLYDESLDQITVQTQFAGESVVTYTSPINARSDFLKFDEWHFIWFDAQLARITFSVDGKILNMTQVNTGPELWGSQHAKGGLGIGMQTEQSTGTENTDGGMPEFKMAALSMWTKNNALWSWGSSAQYDLYLVGTNQGLA